MKKLGYIILSATMLVVSSCDYWWVERGTHRNADNLSWLSSALFDVVVDGTVNAMYQAFRVDLFMIADTKEALSFGGVTEDTPGVYTISNFGTIKTGQLSLFDKNACWDVTHTSGAHFIIKGGDGLWTVEQDGKENSGEYDNLKIENIHSSSTVTLDGYKDSLPMFSVVTKGTYDEGNGYKTSFESVDEIHSFWSSNTSGSGSASYTITYVVNYKGQMDFNFFKNGEKLDWVTMTLDDGHINTSLGESKKDVYY